MNDHRNHAVTNTGSVPGRPSLTFGQNSHGVKVWDGAGKMTASFGSLGAAVYAYDRGVVDYGAHDEDFGMVVPTWVYVQPAVEDLSSRLGKTGGRVTRPESGFVGLNVELKGGSDPTKVPRRILRALAGVAKKHNVIAVLGGTIDRIGGKWMTPVGFVYSQSSVPSPLIRVADTFGSSGSTHYSYATGIEAGPIDEALIKPHTSWMGNRGVRINFGADEDAADGGWVRMTERVLYSDTPKSGRPWVLAARHFAGSVLQSHRSLTVWYTRKGSALKITGASRGSILQKLSDDALLAGQQYGVSVATSNAPEGVLFYFMEEGKTGWNFGADEEALGQAADEDFGRLYRSPPFHLLEQASPGDLGALQGRSGGSGYRGGRPTFGEEDPQVYGADARIEIGPLRYQGSPWGAAALGAAALILLFQGPMSS